MTVVDPTGGPAFHEADAHHRVESIPLSHLSVELGHLFAEDFDEGYDALCRHFARVAPWLAAASAACASQVPGRRARVSTCFLVDDYVTRFGTPGAVVDDVRRAAAQSAVAVDYVVRGSTCVVLDGVDVARLVADRIVEEPAPATTGARPPATEGGWLSNGQRSPTSGAGAAMAGPSAWHPPVETAANRHSVFVDVQLWDEDGATGRIWSGAFLSAVWQLLRLGLLRHAGVGLIRPVAVDAWLSAGVTDDWDAMPAVLQLNQHAAPFCAYRTYSVVSARHLPVEHAVRTILNQVAVEEAVQAQLRQRSEAEGMALPEEVVQRIGYLFEGG